MKNKSVQIDLTHLFQPAIADGPHSYADFQEAFSLAQDRMETMRQKNLLGYAGLPADAQAVEAVLQAAAKYKNIKNVVVLGIGGSALGAQSLYYALRGGFYGLGSKQTAPRLFVLDHIEPCAFLELPQYIDAKDSLFVLISKSGDTSETLAQYLALVKSFGKISKENLFVITDPQKGFLREMATNQGLPTLPVPSAVGGRFSVFSAVGLFPLALAGIDIERLIAGAGSMQNYCNDSQLTQNPAGLMATAWYHWLHSKNLSQVVMMPYSDRLRFVSDWFAQLFGESLGKQGLGYTPIKAVGVTDQHSQLQLYLEGPRDKLITFLEVSHYDDAAQTGVSENTDERIAFLHNTNLKDLMQAEKKATEESLRENGRPNQTITLPSLDEYPLGQLYQLFMNVVPLMGALMNINPFDQPAVERIKRLTFGLMGRKGFENEAAHFQDAKRNPLIFYSDEKI